MLLKIAVLAFAVVSQGDEIPGEFFEAPLPEAPDETEIPSEAPAPEDDPLNQLIRNEPQPAEAVPAEIEPAEPETSPVPNEPQIAPVGTETNPEETPEEVFAEEPSYFDSEEVFDDSDVNYEALRRFQFRFQENETGAWVLFPFAEVNLPREVNGRSIQYKFGSKPYGQKGSRLGIAMEASKEILSDPAGEQLAAVKLPAIQPAIIAENCGKIDVAASSDAPIPASVYVGVYCQLTEQEELKFWISLPSDVTWGEMSLFELAGKGERWREYSVSNFTPIVEEQVIARFKYFYEGKGFELVLRQTPNADLLKEAESKKQEISALQSQAQMIQSEAERLQEENKELQKTVEQAKQDNKYFHASFMLGGGMIGVKTNTGVSKTSFQPSLQFDIATIDLFYSLGAGARVKYVLPPGASDVYDISAGLQSTWEFGQIMIRPGIGFHTFNNDVSSEGLAFRHTSVGIDFYTQYGKKWQVWGLISASGYLPFGDSQYMSVQLGYRRPFNQFFLWGVEAAYQRTTFDDVDGTFQQILFSGSINY